MNTAPHASSTHPGSLVRFWLATVPVALAAALGSAATLPNIAGWYQGLAKPPFTPPNGVFGPAWAVLFGMMAYAVWRVLRTPVGTKGRRTALVLFGAQLSLNAAWSWAFFAAKSPALGGLVIAALDVSVAAAILAIGRVDRPAAVLLVPYLAWVLFATYLNLGVWRLNG